jgi:hypothetical protein
MNRLKTIAMLGCAVAAMLLAWAHQALTKDASKPLVVLSTSDVIGYTSPCG